MTQDDPRLGDDDPQEQSPEPPQTPEPDEVPPDRVTEGEEIADLPAATPEPLPVDADQDIKARPITPEPDPLEGDTSEFVYDRRTPEPPEIEAEEPEADP